MTEVADSRRPAAPEPAQPGKPVKLKESSWALSIAGVRTVYGLELRQRLRSRWWAITIAIWFTALAALTTLIYMTVTGDESSRRAGATMFGVVTILVLSLAALVSPALSATSINGDRSQGVLAALQSTLLTPAELVIGKLLASWTSALSLIATAMPFFAWAFLLGGTTGRRLITTLVLISITLLVVCAIGLGCSALVVRTSGSAAQTYLLVTLLGLGLPLIFGLSLQLVERPSTKMRPETTSVGMDASGNELTGCQMRLSTRSLLHSEYTWWLLAASPYVVVADASPAEQEPSGSDPLSEIRSGVRLARLGPDDGPDTCAELQQQTGPGPSSRQAEADNLPATWPYGLAIDLLIGAAFTVGAIRRLHIPAKRLPRGTRVA
jgi:ABC-type transport system involved in multi-copper enzyme maturation permease subunit